MKILIISGTPKQDGICDSLVKAALSAADESGAETEVVKLSEHKISHCVMCGDGWGICNGEHKCAHDDNFNALQEKVREADAFIYVTPVYWGEVSEVLKTFLDKLRRCQATKQWNKNDAIGSFLRGKPNILVANAGGGGGGIVNTFAQIERAISHMGGGGNRGVYDYIAVNRWNQEYKREALQAAVKSMIESLLKV
jgi:multimeric flavodoxin WrbA